MKVTILIFLTLTILVPSGAIGQDFLVFQEFFYTNQPPDSYFEGLGIKTDHIVYQGQLGAPAVESMVRAAAHNSLGKSYDAIVQLDHEYWENNTKIVSVDSAKLSVQKMCELLRWFKSEEPTLRVGFYGFVPITDIYAYQNPSDSLAWIANNNLTQPLADSVDYLCPSLYCFYSDTAQFAGYARAIIREARRLAKGKPVYPYVSPQYHPSGDHAGQHVSHDYFAWTLKTVKDAGADGVIIWGGTANIPSLGGWDPNAGWWLATKEFMEPIPKDSIPRPDLSSLTNAFLVFQKIFYSNQPQDSYFEEFGIKTGSVVYQDQLGAPAVESMVRAEAHRSLGKSYNSMVQIVEQHWENNTKIVSVDSAKASVQKMCETLRWFKSEEPTLRVGCYSFVPITDLYAYLDRSDSLVWIANNNLLQPLADSVDYFCPSLYAYYADTAQYAGYARAIIREAKRLANGKPVYPFVSPKYHPSGDHPGQHVTQAYFAWILKIIKDAGADGVIIWGGTGNIPSGDWDPNAGWWKATMEFMRSLGKDSFSSPDPPALEVPSKGVALEPSSFESRWRSSTGATGYHVQLADNITFQNPILNDSTITDTVQQVGPFKSNSKYYFRVRAKGTTSWSSYCINADFSTLEVTSAKSANLDLPTGFDLEQNFPNPFNPVTTIRYGLPVTSQISLVVYNVLGQLVQELIAGKQDPGFHDVAFDGSRLPSGIYFYTLRAGSFVVSKKLVLLK